MDLHTQQYFSEKPLMRGLTAYWKMNNNFVDSILSSNWELTGNSGNYSRFRFDTGYFGNGGKCTGAIAVRSLATVFSLTDGINDIPFSFSILIKLDSLPTGSNYYTIVNKRRSGTGAFREYLGIIEPSGKINFRLYDTSNTDVDYKITFSKTALSVGIWYRITFTSDGTSVKIYLNSSDDTDTTTIVGVYTKMGLSNSEFFSLFNISYISPLANAQLYGTMDEFAFWKYRTLSAGEIKKLYERGCVIF